MKKFIMQLLIVMILGFSVQAHAALFDRGMDIDGNSLIYDSDLDITWYDFASPSDTWQNQVEWAVNLDIDFNSTHYTDWRLPTTVDGAYFWGFDGTSTAGYNITNSEMGHLFYTELGNDGWFDISGVATGCSTSSPYCLSNTDAFQNLEPEYFWSGTEYSLVPGNAWFFGTGDGSHNVTDANVSKFAFAVRNGDVSVVPEPMSMILFITGGVVLAVRKKLSKVVL